MSQRGLESLLRPKSIAVIGASEKKNRAGYLVMRNLLTGGFSGPVLPVTPAYKAVCGVLAYANIQNLPLSPDLAIICTNAERNLQLLDELGAKGCKTAIILSAPYTQFAELKSYAQRLNMRLLGPNSLGLLAPWQGLNASFSPIPLQKGRLAFISQSAAVGNTILDWAQQREIGFSYFIALGDSVDIDLHDLLDFFARDSKTSAILLHIENINNARRFLSAARSASRNKPIIAIKSGRYPQTQTLLNNQTGSDAAFDAALQRAGILRVQNTQQLFAAVETLSYMHPLHGERLMIVSNGNAPAAMALDELLQRNGQLATLGSDIVDKLSQVLPDTVTISNPLNLHDDATTQRYIAALAPLLNCNDYDAILFIYVPSAAAPATETAESLIAALNQHPRGKRITVLTSWCGEYSSQDARRAFSDAGIPTYRTPEGAITAFMHMVEYRRNQKQLKETPTLPIDLTANTTQAHELIRDALNAEKYLLDTHQIEPILNAYGLNTLSAWIAKNSSEAVYLAEQIGYPVALKLRASAIPHKSEIQGVMLYLYNATEVRQAAESILLRATQAYPNVLIEGLLVQHMANRSGALELAITVKQDAIFGPIIMLGENSIGWRKNEQFAVGLLPLNMTLARYLITQALKCGYIRVPENIPPLNISGLSQLLVQVSNLALDCPEIIRMEINPLLASRDSFTLLDVSMQLSPVSGDPQARLAIRPYPQELKEWITLKDGGQCLLRPISPEDEPLQEIFLNRVTKEDLYYRYFSEISEFTHDDFANMTQIDYDREMAFVAIIHSETTPQIAGVSRAMSDPDNAEAEFAVLVRSDLKGMGLGKILMNKLIQYARQRGIQRLTGMTMPNNRNMITLAQKCGFDIDVQLEDGVVNLTLSLT